MSGFKQFFFGQLCDTLMPRFQRLRTPHSTTLEHDLPTAPLGLVLASSTRGSSLPPLSLWRLLTRAGDEEMNMYIGSRQIAELDHNLGDEAGHHRATLVSLRNLQERSLG